MEISGGSLAVVVSNTGALDISGNIVDDNHKESLTLEGDGTGRLYLSGSDSYGGGTDVQAGTLIVASNTAFPSGSKLTVGASAGALFDSPEIGMLIVNNPSDVYAGSGAVPVPEPPALVILLAGLAVGLAAWRRMGRCGDGEMRA